MKGSIDMEVNTLLREIAKGLGKGIDYYYEIYWDV